MEFKQTKTIAIIGLSTMGSNLALNFASKGIRVIVYNRSIEKTKALENHNNIVCAYSLQELFEAFGDQTRIVLLMVKAGVATDLTIDSLEPFLKTEDYLIDLGNAHPFDSLRRQEKAILTKSYNYCVCGISGGSEGARNGACLMFSGLNKEAWLNSGLKDILEVVSAKNFDNQATLGHFGSNVEGNYVKTIHNGIEYVQLQVLAEIYHFLRLELGVGLGLSLEKISTIFKTWAIEKNDYLLEVFAQVTKNKELDKVLPLIGSKGTGKWTTQLALEKDLPLFLIPLAYNLRLLSETLPLIWPNYKEQLETETETNITNILEKLSQIYDLGYQYALKEGLDILKSLKPELDQSLALQIWQGGCIIRNLQLQTLDPDFEPNHLKFFKLYHELALDKAPQIPLLAMIKELTELKISGMGQANTISLARNIFGDHKIKLKGF
jgi:6-phosphogluconate dehydrogenase